MKNNNIHNHYKNFKVSMINIFECRSNEKNYSMNNGCFSFKYFDTIF